LVYRGFLFNKVFGTSSEVFTSMAILESVDGHELGRSEAQRSLVEHLRADRSRPGSFKTFKTRGMDIMSRTAVHAVVDHDRPELLAIALANQGAVNPLGHEEGSLLHRAIRGQQHSVIDMLFQHEGLNLNAKNTLGETALIVASRLNHDPAKDKLLHELIRRRSSDDDRPPHVIPEGMVISVVKDEDNALPMLQLLVLWEGHSIQITEHVVRHAAQNLVSGTSLVRSLLDLDRNTVMAHLANREIQAALLRTILLPTGPLRTLINLGDPGMMGGEVLNW
jgi:ankyrin repeat protein